MESFGRYLTLSEVLAMIYEYLKATMKNSLVNIPFMKLKYYMNNRTNQEINFRMENCIKKMSQDDFDEIILALNSRKYLSKVIFDTDIHEDQRPHASNKVIVDIGQLYGSRVSGFSITKRY